MNLDILTEVKKVELDILNVIHKICVDNNLRYSLAYGSLLGAIRHKGFIPWDDDVDIYMPREDYNKFLDILSKSPIEGYVLTKLEKDNDYINLFVKLRKDKTTFLQPNEENYKYHKGIFVDIFPCDYIANTKLKKNLQKIDVFLKTLYARSHMSSKSGKLTQLVCNFLLKIIPKKKHHSVSLFFEQRLIKNGIGGNRYFDTCTLKAMTYELPNDTFDDLQLVQFENQKYYITKRWNEVLTIAYGDYMKLPPKEERVWKHTPILIDLEHNYEEIKDKN